MKKNIILIGVCTYNRPNMLRKCLNSIKTQEIPKGAEIIIYVADNNSEPLLHIKDVVDECLQGLKYKYLLVEKRGISFARNAILDCAVESKADFIAFIDDDQYADLSWINNLYKKITEAKVEAVQGKVIYVLPEETPDFIQKEWQVGYSEDTLLKHLGTGNVIFASKLVNDWGLRFRNELALTGGEDLDFFLRSQHNGGKHIYTAYAVVFETVPDERATVKWQLKRKMQDGYALSAITYANYGMLRLLRKYILKAFRNLVTAPFYLLSGTLTGNNALKFKAMQKIYHAIGCFAFTLRIKVHGYSNVTGG